jgi:hypothetical protein
LNIKQSKASSFVYRPLETFKCKFLGELQHIALLL